MGTQLVLAAEVVTALICATVLSLHGSRWMGAAMVVLALIGLLMSGGADAGQKKPASDGGKAG
jgi:hypothetical protein